MILEKILMPKVKKACLTYDNSFLCDGAGAQIQRIAAIYGIAMKYRCMFAKTEILDIDSNPGDGIKSVKEKIEFVSRLNEILVYPLGGCTHSKHSIVNTKLNWIVTKYNWYRLWILLNNLIYVRTVQPLIKINHTLLTRNISPDVYSNYAFKIKSNPNFNLWQKNKYNHEIQVHLSVAKVDRIRMPERYIDIQKINVIVKKLKKKYPNHKVLIHTDIDAKQNNWKAVGSQSQETINYWKSRGIIDDSGKMALNKMEFNEQFEEDLVDEIISGISPLDVWKIMINSKILICGKSSLSFVGAILSHSPDTLILFPKGFVKLPKKWVEIDYNSNVASLNF
jgi:hypothetical protein